MEIPVLIETVENNGYRVTTGPPVVLSVEAATREKAIEQLRQALDSRLSAGAEITSIEVSTSGNPLAPYAGMFRDNPLFDVWQEAISEYRRQVDEEQEAP